MSRFAIKYPFLIIVICLGIAIVGTVALVRMPVDLFPPINIPVVVIATFYSGMPPQQIETNITNPFERWFTLASGVDHIESRSLPGVSLIKIYFQPGTNADADLSSISNLAMADLRRLPPGTLPPVVLKFDASSLPVCLITLKGEGLNETQLHDLGQYNVRNQIANVPGASVPQPFGGKYREIMVYVDPLKLQAHQLSPMDVVREINESNLILPTGDVKIGPFDYNLYSNSQAPSPASINDMPLKSVGQSSVLVGDVGKAVDAQAIQTNIVRVDGQPSVYLPSSVATPTIKPQARSSKPAVWRARGHRKLQFVSSVVMCPPNLCSVQSTRTHSSPQRSTAALMRRSRRASISPLYVAVTILTIIVFLPSDKA